jgi:hypothetical protein
MWSIHANWISCPLHRSWPDGEKIESRLKTWGNHIGSQNRNVVLQLGRADRARYCFAGFGLESHLVASFSAAKRKVYDQVSDRATNLDHGLGSFAGSLAAGFGALSKVNDCGLRRPQVRGRPLPEPHSYADQEECWQANENQCTPLAA